MTSQTHRNILFVGLSGGLGAACGRMMDLWILKTDVPVLAMTLSGLTAMVGGLLVRFHR
jgi:hypothetical protein